MPATWNSSTATWADLEISWDAIAAPGRGHAARPHDVVRKRRLLRERRMRLAILLAGRR